MRHSSTKYRRLKWQLTHTAAVMQARAAAGHHIRHAGRREVLRLLRRLPRELPASAILHLLQLAAYSRLLRSCRTCLTPRCRCELGCPCLWCWRPGAAFGLKVMLSSQLWVYECTAGAERAGALLPGGGGALAGGPLAGLPAGRHRHRRRHPRGAAGRCHGVMQPISS
jgi:hypothetical protein